MNQKNAAAAADGTRPAKGGFGHELVEGVKTIGSALLIALVFRSFIFEPFNIPSASMLPGLLVGDYLLVSKWSYGYSRYSFPFSPPVIDGRAMERQPERGDVVVFRNPGNPRQDYIKRVIGLPGDQIYMENGVLHLNGVAVPKRRIGDFDLAVSADPGCNGVRVEKEGALYCRYPLFEETLPGGRSFSVLDTIEGGPGDSTPVFVVPQAQYFMMGDNRDDSTDSRFAVGGPLSGIGFVPASHLVGRAEVMFFSIDASARWYAPWTWPGAIRFDRIGNTF